MKKISKLIFTLVVSCISIGSVFADVDVDTKTFDLWGAKAVWNKDAQTLYINGINGNGKVDKAKWEKLKETLSLREDVASAVRITFTDGARFPDDASSFFENVKGKISFKSTIPLDTSNVVNMRAMFAGTKFNQDISSWNTSNVTDMSHMFSGATVFNQPLNTWDTSKVTDMSHMFDGATVFNQPLNTWDVSNVTDMSYMFAGVRYRDGNIYNRTSSFNQPLWNWNVSKVTNMSHMFDGARNFNQDISNWNTSSVTDMSWLFAGAVKFNKPLNNWDTSKVTTMAHMFDSLRLVPIPAPDNSRMFYDNSSHSFNQDISSWNTSNVTDMSYMFAWAVRFNQDISNWNTSKVTDMSFMFSSAKAFNQPLKSWNTSNVTATTAMFCFSRFNQEIGDWDTSKVTSMKGMFCHSPFNQDISKWNTSKVTDMSWMFENTPFNKPIENWDVSKVTDMSWMFISARTFNQSLNSWDVSNVTDMHGMFNKANHFNQPLNNWDVSKVENINNMFDRATSFDQDLSSWNPKSLKTGVNFIRSTKFSVENNDKLLISWSKKVPNTSDKTPVGIDVPACEAAGILKNLDSNYDFEMLKSDNECKVLKYVLFKDKDRGLPISFEVNTQSRTREKTITVNGKREKILEKYWILPKIDSKYLYEKDKKKPKDIEDIGLTYTGEFVDDTKETMRFTIEGIPSVEGGPYTMTISSIDKDTKKKNLTQIIIIVKSKYKRPNDLTIPPNQNEKPTDNWKKDKPKDTTPLVDKDMPPLEKLDPKPESLEGKNVFPDDEIFNPTIVNGQCYTRRPYLWIKDSVTIVTDEEFKKALSFLRSYEMTMFDSVDGYDPYRDLSREEAAKIFSNFAINVLCRKPDLNLKVNYSDVENADPTLKPYITLAYQLGVMKGSGMGDGRFRPFDKITKAEVNAVLIRMILKSYLDETRSESKKWYSEYNSVATALWIINQGAGAQPVSRNNVALMLFRAYKQQVFEWRLIDYYSYVLQSRDLFVK